MKKDIIEWANKDKGIKRTNMKGWHSTTNMHELPIFKTLVNMLYKMSKNIYQQEHYDSEPVLGNMWANINPPGGMNRAHQHPNSFMSGVYYIKAPKNSGQIVFNMIQEHQLQCLDLGKKKEKNPKICRETHYEPIAGRCIMFPSWLWHCVDPNESNDIRISVSFNFLYKKACMYDNLNIK